MGAEGGPAARREVQVRSPTGEVYRRIDAQVRSDQCTWTEVCRESPHFSRKTCPVCVCGLLPVIALCWSAVYHLDSAARASGAGAPVINELGLSYTVYYTAGCWPARDLDPASVLMRPTASSVQAAGQDVASRPCNTDHFEIAAGEFDAVSGGLLTSRNVTRLHARRVESVKLSPDRRYVVFVGALANDIGNLYAVGADDTDAEQAVSLLTERQLDALDEQCQFHSREVLQAASLGSGAAAPTARLAGFKHLQVIIPGDPPQGTDDGDVGRSALYRAALAFECAETVFSASRRLEFSKLALVDFQLVGLNDEVAGGEGGRARRSAATAWSELRVVDAVPGPPRGASGRVQRSVTHYRSQSCPRFVPSHRGRELLFVAESLLPPAPAPLPGSAALPTPLPSRWLATVNVPLHSEAEVVSSRRLRGEAPPGCCRAQTAQCFACREGKTRIAFCADARNAGVVGCEGRGLELAAAAISSERCCTALTAVCLACTQGQSVGAFCAEPRNVGLPGCGGLRAAAAPALAGHQSLVTDADRHFSAVRSGATLLDVGEGALPLAPVRGCPEFVPGLYSEGDGPTEPVSDAPSAAHPPEAGREANSAASPRARDTFVVASEPPAPGAGAQVLAASLPEGLSEGTVGGVHLLYSVDSVLGGGLQQAGGGPAPGRPRFGGCQPVRAAQSDGEGLRRAREAAMGRSRPRAEEEGQITAWLACLTADQKVAMVDSPARERWVNMTMPYPVWAEGPAQDVWCPEDRQEACFEVWSNSGPQGTLSVRQ